jgi:hypothetical protein
MPLGNMHYEVGPICPYVVDTNSYFGWTGLAETLRSELLLYSVSVHIFFPGTIYSPGYTQENKTKPKITLKIEETDDGLTPEQAASGLLRGMPSDLLTLLHAWHAYFGLQAYKRDIFIYPPTSWDRFFVPLHGVRHHTTMYSWTQSTVSSVGLVFSPVSSLSCLMPS